MCGSLLCAHNTKVEFALAIIYEVELLRTNVYIGVLNF